MPIGWAKYSDEAFPLFPLQGNYDEGVGSLHPPNEKVLGVEVGVSKSEACLVKHNLLRGAHDSCFETENILGKNCNLFHYHAVWAMVQSLFLCRHVIATLRP